MFWSKKKESDEEYVKLKELLKDETNKATQFHKKVTELGRNCKSLGQAMKKAATQLTTGLRAVADDSGGIAVEGIVGPADIVDQDFDSLEKVSKEKCIDQAKMRLDHLRSLKKMANAADTCEAKYHKQVSAVTSLEKKKKVNQEKIVQAKALKEHLEGKHKEEIDKVKVEIERTLGESDEFYEKLRLEYCTLLKESFGKLAVNYTKFCDEVQNACGAIGKL